MMTVELAIANGVCRYCGDKITTMPVAGDTIVSEDKEFAHLSCVNTLINSDITESIALIHTIADIKLLLDSLPGSIEVVMYEESKRQYFNPIFAVEKITQGGYRLEIRKT